VTMQIFVAGATGVIGRRLVPLLLEAGHRVTGIARTPGKRSALERAGADAVMVSLFEPGDLLQALAGHDTVINVATHIPSTTRMLFPGAWRENDRVRREGAANLASAAAAAGAARFIQESFAPMYADGGDRWLDESAPVRPARYNLSTLDAERAAHGFGERGGTAVVLRFATFYGPDAYHVPGMIKLVRKGWAAFPGSAGAFVSSVTHDDAAGAAAAALEVPGGTYNVVEDEPVSHREYFDVLARTLGVPAPRLPPGWATPLFGPAGELLARSLRISNRKLREASGWAPRHPSVREGWPAVIRELRAGAASR